MAEKRMFTKKITESDSFLDMPLSTQCLYFHLNMSADDDGFINNPKRIMRAIGAKDDDLKLLILKSFVIEFESGVIVIKHWRMHNYIQSDRYKPTDYSEEFAMLGMKKNKAYTLGETEPPKLMDTKCIQNVSDMDTQNRLDKNREDKNSLEEIRQEENIPADAGRAPKHKHGEYQHVLLTDDEVNRLMDEYGEAETTSAIKYLDEYIEMNGRKYKNHNLVLRKWVFDAVKEKQKKKPERELTLKERLDMA